MGHMTLLGAGKPPAASGGSTTTMDPAKSRASVVFSNGDLTLDLAATTVYSTSLSVAGYSTGKKFCSMLVNTVIADNAESLGLASGSQILTSFIGDGDGVAYWRNGEIKFNGSTLLTVSTWDDGDIIDMAVDLGAKLIWFRKNGGDWNGDVIGNQNPDGNVGGLSYTGISAGPWYAAACLIYDGDSYTMNFGATSYTYSAPSGYGNW